MKNLLLAVAAATTLLGATALTTSAQAAPQASVVFGVDRDSGPLAVTPAQYVYLGHNYCWYDAGWRGAGFYWCGYAMRRGYGWGGGENWRGWGRGGGSGGRAVIVNGGRGGYRGGTRYGATRGAVQVAPARTGGGHGARTGGAHTTTRTGGHTGDHRQ